MWQQHRSLDEYVAKIAMLPIPTDEQIKNFCFYVMHDHSWYKGSILRGEEFMFFLNADLGPDSHGESPLNRQDFRRSTEYLHQFGHLDYDFGHERIQVKHRDIPSEVRVLGTTLLYPYVSNMSNAPDLIWYRNKDAITSIDETKHPDCESIKSLYAIHKTRKELHSQAGEAYGSEKFFAVEMLRAYETPGYPLNGNHTIEKAKYLALLSDTEMRELQPWCDRVEEATEEEKKAYEMLNFKEKDKILTTLSRLKNWLIDIRA